MYLTALLVVLKQWYMSDSLEKRTDFAWIGACKCICDNLAAFSAPICCCSHFVFRKKYDPLKISLRRSLLTLAVSPSPSSFLPVCVTFPSLLEERRREERPNGEGERKRTMLYTFPPNREKNLGRKKYKRPHLLQGERERGRGISRYSSLTAS